MHPVSVGVDFGTSNTVIAVADGQRKATVVPVVSRGTSTAALPSILCFQPNSLNPRAVPGSSAGFEAIADYVGRSGPARLVQSMKSFLGSKGFVDTRIFSHSFTLEALIETLLKHLYDAASAHELLRQCPLIVGRPIQFAGATADDDLAQSRLMAAFEGAACKVHDVRLEPEAAAYAFARSARGHHRVLV